MIHFPEHKKCKECPLWESATNPGIPTRPFSQKISRGIQRGTPLELKSKAILIVGEAPGYQEDRDDMSWIGHAGTILNRFLDVAYFEDYADIYLANACRCRPPQNSDPTTGNLNACRVHLQADLDTLCRHYNEVIIFCCGRYGAEAVTKQSGINKCFSMQGQLLSYFNKLKKGGLSPVGEKKVRVFFTYHPALLLPGRQPHQVITVADHFTLLLRYLKEEFIPNSLEVIPQYGVVPDFSNIPQVVCVDIETYGILKGHHQSVFHPLKSKYIDNVPLGKQIITVAFGFFDPKSPTGFSTYVYDFKRHKSFIHKWFRHITSSGTTLLGQNIKFDILYLKLNSPNLNILLNASSLKLDDTLLASFLFFEQRPEKGLKELATLFGITDYRSLKVTASSGTATGPTDPNLLYYNCLDVATTLALYGFTWTQIRDRYGADSPKLQGTCEMMRNIVLWDTIMLEMSGATIDRKKLEAIDTEYCKKCKQYVEEAANLGVIIAGDGSEKSSREFMESALKELGLLNDGRVQLTDKKKEISVGKDNFNLLLEYAGEKFGFWQPLQAISAYHKASKIVNSYTKVILQNPKRGLVCGNMIYPSWYPMRGIANKYSGEDKIGGTIQARFSARGPAAQTFPPVIKKCFTSRFPAGQISVYDLSQIELRMAALLSGDPVMLQEYVDGIDRHANTALFFWPDADITSDEFTRKPDGQRQAGKTTNFLIVYKGGALKLQETILII